MTAPPRINEVVVDKEGRMNQRLWALLKGANPNQDVTPITVGASPFVLTNTSGYASSVIVSGGTVSLVEFGRSGAFYTIGTATNQTVNLSPGDSLRVTYSVLPTIIGVPR